MRGAFILLLATLGIVSLLSVIVAATNGMNVPVFGESKSFSENFMTWSRFFLPIYNSNISATYVNATYFCNSTGDCTTNLWNGGGGGSGITNNSAAQLAWLGVNDIYMNSTNWITNRTNINGSIGLFQTLRATTIKQNGNTVIDSSTIGSQSVNYAGSSGYAPTNDVERELLDAGWGWMDTYDQGSGSDQMLCQVNVPTGKLQNDGDVVFFDFHGVFDNYNSYNMVYGVSVVGNMFYFGSAPTPTGSYYGDFHIHGKIVRTGQYQAQMIATLDIGVVGGGAITSYITGSSNNGNFGGMDWGDPYGKQILLYVNQDSGNSGKVQFKTGELFRN
jgi:hypothetical protein